MIRDGAEPATWTGKSLSVEILFSRPGIATQIWLGYPGGGFLVDIGDGSLRDLLEHSYHPKTIGGVICTHGHFDHVGGLHSILGYLRMIGRTKPLQLIGPPGCVELWKAVESFRHFYEDSTPFEILCTEMHDRQVVQIDGVSIMAFPVVHCGSIATGLVLDQVPALGYRVSLGGETVAITGDTGFCDTLQDLVADADLAVLEATFAESEGVSPEVLNNVHLSEDVARKVGRQAKRYMLVHRGAGPPVGPFLSQ